MNCFGGRKCLTSDRHSSTEPHAWCNPGSVLSHQARVVVMCVNLVYVVSYFYLINTIMFNLVGVIMTSMKLNFKTEMFWSYHLMTGHLGYYKMLVNSIILYFNCSITRNNYVKLTVYYLRYGLLCACTDLWSWTLSGICRWSQTSSQ